MMTPEQINNDADLPPEYCRYQDAGCELASSCLKCTLPEYVYEQPRGKQQCLKSLRNKQLVKQFTGGGKSIRELALTFGVSQRTVQRVLKKSVNKGGQRDDK